MTIYGRSNSIAKPKLIILGASTRAAAASALRAGFVPWCADLFADADLRRACPARRVAMADYPEGLIAAALEAPPGPWMYTGALENRPDIVAKIDRPLWGNPPEVLRRVRSPFLVAEALRRRQLPVLDVRAAPPPGDQRRWLAKPRRSAGGVNIRFYLADSAFNPKRLYLQEFIDGASCSAVFLGDADHPAQLLGITQQLVGEPWLHAAPYRWCGNVGPLILASETDATLQRIGQVLVEDFALHGLFGVDFILRDGVPWPVEVNPRYPASVEVLERATGESYLKLHGTASLRACPGGARLDATAENVPATGNAVRTSGASPEARGTTCTVWGKAILFAQQSFEFPGNGPWESALRMPLEDPTVPFADIPMTGATIAAGQPICTLFASAATVADCLAQVQSIAHGLVFV